jgi:hypothetical protein
LNVNWETENEKRKKEYPFHCLPHHRSSLYFLRPLAIIQNSAVDIPTIICAHVVPEHTTKKIGGTNSAAHL